jgi:hypothetical protein
MSRARWPSGGAAKNKRDEENSSDSVGLADKLSNGELHYIKVDDIKKRACSNSCTFVGRT